jgi:hypothetical protein
MGLLPPSQFDKMSRTAMTIIPVPASIRRFAIVPSNTTKPPIAKVTMQIDPNSARDVQTFNNALRARFGKEIRLDLSEYKRLMTRARSLQTNKFSTKDSVPPLCPEKEICYLTKMTGPPVSGEGGAVHQEGVDQDNNA